MIRKCAAALALLLFAATTVVAAGPDPEGMKHQHGAADTASKPADCQMMGKPMPCHGDKDDKDCGMMGKECDKGDHKAGMGCDKGGKKGGCGDCGEMGGHDAFKAVAVQDLLQTLQEMAKVQEQLAAGLKGAEKTRIQKDIAEIAKRLDRLQNDLRDALKKGHKEHGHH